jgi:hypothetical protein
VTGNPTPQSSRTTGTKVPVSDVKQPQSTQDQSLDKKSDTEPVKVAPESDTVQNVRKRDLRSLRSR